MRLPQVGASLAARHISAPGARTALVLKPRDLSATTFATAVQRFLPEMTLDQQRALVGQIDSMVASVNVAQNVRRPLLFDLVQNGKALLAKLSYEGRPEVVAVEVLQTNGKPHPHLKNSLNTVAKKLFTTVGATRIARNQERAQNALSNLFGEIPPSVTFDLGTMQTFQLISAGKVNSAKLSRVKSAAQEVVQMASSNPQLKAKIVTQRGDVVALMSLPPRVRSEQAIRGRGCFRPSSAMEKTIVLSAPDAVNKVKMAVAESSRR